MKQALQNKLFEILRKYGLIIIGYALFSRFAHEFLMSVLNSLSLLEHTLSENFISSSILIIANLIVWILMLSDVGHNRSLKWLLFGVTLLNPWMGVAFIVIYKAFNLMAETSA